MKKKRPRDSYLDVLLGTTRLAASIVKECTETKILTGTNLWVVGLVAKASSTARAVHNLAAQGLTTETKLLNRSIYDGLIDLLYIKEDPCREKDLSRLFLLEMAVDRYEHLRFLAQADKTDISGVVRKEAHLQAIVDDYDRAKRDPAFKPPEKRRRRWWPRRWRFIRAEEKLEHLGDFRKALKLIEYGVRHLGDAHAHHRPSALRVFFYQQKDGSPGVLARARSKDFLYSAEWVAFEACLLLLVMCDQVVEKFFLGDRFEQGVKKLLDRLQGLPCVHELATGRRRPRVRLI